MINRWGTDVRKGTRVSAHHPRGGTITGSVTRLYTMSGYGKRVDLDTGYSIGLDDVFKTEPPAVKFRELSVGQTFDWIAPDPTRTSFYLRCTKITARKYRDERGDTHEVGTINAAVYHAEVHS